MDKIDYEFEIIDDEIQEEYPTKLSTKVIHAFIGFFAELIAFILIMSILLFMYFSFF